MFGDLLKGNAATGLLIGVGALVLAPVMLPALAAIGKPVAKAFIKGGIIFFEKSRETFAELGEVAEDLVAEARSELAEQHATATPPQVQGEPARPGAPG